eukprot:1488029-Pleurochrysis_carterae.AAC.4
MNARRRTTTAGDPVRKDLVSMTLFQRFARSFSLVRQRCAHLEQAAEGRVVLSMQAARLDIPGALTEDVVLDKVAFSVLIA